MKKLSLIILALIVFSCGSNDSEDSASSNILEKLTYAVDTVLINSGQELVDLSGDLRLADLSEDHRMLYLLGQKTKILYVFDLEEKKLIETIPFEKEGPNGLGEYPSSLQLLEGERFVISDYRSSYLFDKAAMRIGEFKIAKDSIEGLETKDEMSLLHHVTLSPDERQLFSLPGNFFEGTRDLLVYDLSKSTGKQIDIPAMDLAGTFRVVLQTKDMMMVSIEDINFSWANGRLFIYSNSTSDLYSYDYQEDSLRLHTFPHSLVETKKTGSVQNTVESQEAFQAEMEKISTQITFGEMIWDSASERYFRFGRIFVPKPDLERKGDDKVYLFAYDKELNLIGEAYLEELKKQPNRSFFKDGKLWSYVNVEDELGFAVMDFKF